LKKLRSEYMNRVQKYKRISLIGSLGGVIFRIAIRFLLKSMKCATEKYPVAHGEITLVA